MKPTSQLLTATVGSAVMLLLFFLLPLVQLMSMNLAIADILHKLPRLVHGLATQLVAYVLLGGMVVAPLLLALSALAQRRQRVVALLPAAFALLLAVALMVTSKPVAPALGLWLYLLVALVTAFVLCQRERCVKRS